MGTEWEVRNFESSDYAELLALHNRIQPAAQGSATSSRFLRVCCESFADTCFVARAGGKPVGFLLCFVRDREAYCTMLAVEPEYRECPVVLDLLGRFVTAIADRVDYCWFTVAHDDVAARALHRMLGAREIGVRVVYSGRGPDMISLRIDRARFEEMGAAAS